MVRVLPILILFVCFPSWGKGYWSHDVSINFGRIAFSSSAVPSGNYEESMLTWSYHFNELFAVTAGGVARFTDEDLFGGTLKAQVSAPWSKRFASFVGFGYRSMTEGLHGPLAESGFVMDFSSFELKVGGRILFFDAFTDAVENEAQFFLGLRLKLPQAKLRAEKSNTLTTDQMGEQNDPSFDSDKP